MHFQLLTVSTSPNPEDVSMLYEYMSRTLYAGPIPVNGSVRPVLDRTSPRGVFILVPCSAV